MNLIWYTFDIILNEYWHNLNLIWYTFDIILNEYWHNFICVGRGFTASRTVYDSHRRYASLNAPLRSRSNAKKDGYEYCGNEERDRPTFREYETYRKNGLKAKKLNENELRRRIGLNINTNFQYLHVDGVYGLWCLDVLPYAKFIHCLFCIQLLIFHLVWEINYMSDYM